MSGEHGLDGARDFDFLVGRWRVVNRRLKRRLEGDTEWEVFEATEEVRPLPGGIGNEDLFRTDFWPGFVGITLRTWHPASRAWSIRWVDSRQGLVLPPVVGGFRGDTGVFLGDDVLAGRPVRVRFTWTRGPAPRWEQSFSPDGGRTWETNWTMDFSRVRDRAPSALGVIELRRYRLVPGSRERFARRFDTVAIDPFDQLRAPIVGQFTVRGDPDAFTWLRGFESFEDVGPAKAAYYDGPHWALHAERTNALLADSDDVLLLRPLAPLSPPPPVDPEVDAGPGGLAVTWVAPAAPGAEDRLAAAAAEPFARVRAAGAREVSVLATLDRPNPFPRHPVRTDGPWLVWLGLVPDEAALARLREILHAAEPGLRAVGLLRGAPEVSVLEPTPRSRLRW